MRGDTLTRSTPLQEMPSKAFPNPQLIVMCSYKDTSSYVGRDSYLTLKHSSIVQD